MPKKKKIRNACPSSSSSVTPCLKYHAFALSDNLS